MAEALNETLRDRLAVAHGCARRAGEGRIANVSIHVAQDVWDTLKAMLPNGAALGVVSTLWGYPIVLEAAWADGTIHVRTTEVIA